MADDVSKLIKQRRAVAKRAATIARKEASQARGQAALSAMISKGRAKQAEASAAQEHRRTADRLIDRQILHPVKEVYEEEANAVARALRKSLQGKLRSSAGAREAYQQLSGALEARMQRMAARLVSEMAHAQRGTFAESANALANFVGKVKGAATVLDDDVARSRITQTQQKAIAELQRDATARLSAGIHEALQQRLTKEVGAGSSIGQAITAISEELDDQWWRVERFARTETANAFNQGQRAGIEALSEEDPGVLMRWTEHVDDFTGAPLDNRVGKDSLVLHGQVAKPGGTFTMPNDPRAPKGMVGASWQHPPNRPNDRAVLLPWVPGMSVPAWMYRGGRKVPLRG